MPEDPNGTPNPIQSVHRVPYSGLPPPDTDDALLSYIGLKTFLFPTVAYGKVLCGIMCEEKNLDVRSLSAKKSSPLYILLLSHKVSAAVNLDGEENTKSHQQGQRVRVKAATPLLWRAKESVCVGGGGYSLILIRFFNLG